MYSSRKARKTNTLINSSCSAYLPTWYAGPIMAQKLNKQTATKQISSPLPEIESMPDIPWVSKNLVLHRPWIWEKPNAIFLLNKSSHKMTPSNILLFPLTLILFSPYRRSSHCNRMRINTEKHEKKMCRVWETFIKSSPQLQGNFVEERR